jgi:DNA-binding MarR family transcriptional regulator
MTATTSRFAATAQLFAAVGHPIRLEVLDAIELAASPLSPKQIADRTGHKLPNVAYHVRILVDDGLIRQTRTRPVRGAVEHFYTLTPRGRRALELVPDDQAVPA